MNDYFYVIARSITHAQRMERLLRRAGLSCWIARAPLELTGRGCAYAVQIREKDLAAAVRQIRGAGFGADRIYRKTNGKFSEVQQP